MRFDSPSVPGEFQLSDILVATLEDLHSLYPDHTPEGYRYALLQHLAVLDLQQQSLLDYPQYLKVPANWQFLHSALIAAINFAVTYTVPPLL